MALTNQPDRVIRVRGARVHNLKNIDVDIPRDRFVVITGLSGSGKSSLAFDTLYAEGQRKFVESLSVHARQFFEQLQKPDVDQVEGLPPTVAIEQRPPSTSPRSTVATTTELYDFFRLLFARVGEPHCWKCDQVLRCYTVEQIVDELLEKMAGQKVAILAPIVHERRGAHREVLRRLAREGFVRVVVDGQMRELAGLEALSPRRRHTIDAVVERALSVRAELRPRLAESLEYALRCGGGMVRVQPVGREGPTGEARLYSAEHRCPRHPDIGAVELEPRTFSFNSPFGACSQCHGLGTRLEFDPALVVPDPSLPLSQGAIDAWRHGGKRMNILYSRLIQEFCEAFQVPPDTPFARLDEQVRRILLYGTTPDDEQRYGKHFEGVIPNLRRRWEKTDNEYIKQRLHAFLSEAPCEACGGARLQPAALAVRIAGRNIHDVVQMSIAEAIEFFEGLDLEGERAVIAAPILREIRHRLRFLCDVGVGYLTLDRRSSTLSGGEAQRIRLATQVGSGLVGVCYVLDEPTIGLHQRDTRKLIRTLEHLRDMGNTVIVVEHDEETIRAADHIIDMGPGAGARGGRVVAQGSLADIEACEESVTGRYLSGRAGIALPSSRRTVRMSHAITILDAHENNLKHLTVRIPLRCFVCVTGVSGSGKSSLITQTLLPAMRRRLYGAHDRPGRHERIIGANHVDHVVQIDQSPIGRSPRSNPATYCGVFDLIRQVFARTREARIRGYGAGRFSFNVRGGRCEACQGQGTRRIEMHFLPDVYVTCDACRGTRYNRETLEVRYRGLNIAQVLDLRVEEAISLFDGFPRIRRILQSLRDVGLGYITLGQASNTLSGGEAQRLKLTNELSRPTGGNTLYLLDEPTTGLHVADIANLIGVLQRLVDREHSVVVIEHNLEVIKMADWIIDLGPEGGEAGGYIVAEGPPEEIARHPDSYTGRYLRSRLEAGRFACA